MIVPSFSMERWQSHHEHRVRYNLSESGVLPLSLAELLELTGVSASDIRLGYPQTNGSDGLKRAIAALYPGAGPENVLVTAGSAEANFIALWHLLEPGDRVVVLVPAYGQTPGLAKGFGASVTTFHLEERLDWQPAPGAAAAAIGPDTRLVVITNPSNPTGSILSAQAMDEIVDACSRRGSWLLADEVYAGAEAEDPPTPSFWGRYGRTLVSGSLSKAYGLPGLRLGWILGPADQMEDLWAHKDYTSISPSAASDALATAVLQHATRHIILSRSRDIILRNRERMEEWIASCEMLGPWVRPRAGAIGMVPYRIGLSSTELADRLRRRSSVLVVPGDHFGLDGYLRIGFGGEEGELVEALARIEELLRSEAKLEADGARGVV
ncbi:MAG: aminotransferase class I/II-fold pyridoxal phosphate-dependent enzyme [Gemmatimonadota bacterium]|nr:MAG: aminotransferase class I/II-fold pyridoxal phosphate-dependent enzyme [Gemmatimonadota bacterium]